MFVSYSNVTEKINFNLQVTVQPAALVHPSQPNPRAIRSRASMLESALSPNTFWCLGERISPHPIKGHPAPVHEQSYSARNASVFIPPLPNCKRIQTGGQ